MADKDEHPPVRMQCGACRTILVCEYGRRRKVMVCPLCYRKAVLRYIPTEDAKGAIALSTQNIPVARRPGTSPSRVVIPAVCFVLGFLVCVAVYALDWGGSVDRMARRLVSAVKGGADESGDPSSSRVAPMRIEHPAF